MRRRLLVASVILTATILLSGCGAQDPAATGGPSADRSPSTAVRSEPPVTPVGNAVSAPASLSIPRLGVSSRLDRLALEPDGSLEKPPHWQVAGWYAGGPRPGADGPAVIAGHIDSPTGPAVFARLAELRPGDVVRVRGTDGSDVAFRVDRLISAPKRHFPTAAVYGPTPDAQLRLITCDGVYDKSRDGYQGNLVVFATRTSS